MSLENSLDESMKTTQELIATLRENIAAMRTTADALMLLNEKFMHIQPYDAENLAQTLAQVSVAAAQTSAENNAAPVADEDGYVPPLKAYNDFSRDAKLDIAHNYKPHVPDGFDTTRIPLVRGQTGLPSGTRDQAYYEKHLRPKLAELSKLKGGKDEVMKIFNFYAEEAKKENREFEGLQHVPPALWDELFGWVKLQIERCKNPNYDEDELKKAERAEKRAQKKAEQEAAQKAAAEVPEESPADEPAGDDLDFGAEPAAEEPVFTLPEGKRDEVFYAKYVRIPLQELATMDGGTDKARAIVNSYGVSKGNLVPSDKWDEFVQRIKTEVSLLKAGVS